MAGLFKSREQDTVTAISAKLVEAEQKLADSEQAFLDALVEASLTDGRAVTAERTARSDAEELVRGLRGALARAERAEAQRVAKLKAEAIAANVRAMRQHIGRWAKAFAEYETHTANARSAMFRVLDAEEAVVKLIPDTDDNSRWHQLRELLRHTYTDLSRAYDEIGAPSNRANGIPALPYANYDRHLTYQGHDRVPMAKRAKERLTGYLDFLVGATATSPVEPVEATGEVPPIEDRDQVYSAEHGMTLGEAKAIVAPISAHDLSIAKAPKTMASHDPVRA